MGIAERKERQKKEVREGILQSAWQMVTEDGWQSLSIRKIADAIEYSVPVVYEHFDNKEAILSVFNKQGYKLLADTLKKAKEEHQVPAQQLEAITHAYWNFAFEHKEYYQLMFGLGMPSCECVRKVPELMKFMEVISTTIKSIATEKSGDQEYLTLKVRSFWSTMHGLVSINLLAPKSNDESFCQEKLNQMVLKDFIDVFIKGLKD